MKEEELRVEKKLSGLIFDLDGVLVYTDHYHFLAWKQIADEMGALLGEKINDRLRGVSRMQSLEIILENYRGPVLTEAEKEDVAERKNRIYRSYLQSMTPGDVSEEVRNTLRILRQRGYALAVGSSSKNAEFILERTGIRKMFDAVADGNQITRSKPDPEVFLLAANLLHCRPGDCAVVEDAEAGIDAAKAGGMTAIAVGKAASYPKADVRLGTFSDLLRYV